MARVSAAKKRLLDKRNQRIWDLYTDENKPWTSGQIAKMLEREGDPISRQHVSLILRRMRKEKMLA